jgi:DNA mismatch endonuclease (patch repair protein)
MVGSPDIAIPSKKKAVFIDGDFWHGYGFSERRSKLPGYWVNKIKTNIKRDLKNKRRLKKEGWTFMRVWEHEIEKNFEGTMLRIMNYLLFKK